MSLVPNYEIRRGVEMQLINAYGMAAGSK